MPAPAEAGVEYGIVAEASVQKVYVRPGDEPSVTAGRVRSDLSGEHNVAGLFTTTREVAGGNGITRFWERADIQPAEFVTE